VDEVTEMVGTPSGFIGCRNNLAVHFAADVSAESDFVFSALSRHGRRISGTDHKRNRGARLTLDASAADFSWELPNAGA
jgi:hypothetical protein